jgi:two-component system, cell cycle sensor histidine kinase and response regulator CckA
MTYTRRLVFLPVIVALFTYLLYSAYDQVRTRTLEQLNAQEMILARQAAKGIESFFDHCTHVLNFLASSEHIIALDEQGKESLRLFYQNYSQDILAITRVDANGRIAYTVPYDVQAIGADLSAQEHIQELLDRRAPVLSDVFTAVQGFQCVAYYVPVMKGTIFDGGLAVLIPFATLARRYLEDIKIGSSGHAWMISAKGVELYCPAAGHVGKLVSATGGDNPGASAMIEKMLQGDEGAASYRYPGDGGRPGHVVTMHAVYLPVRLANTFWSIGVATPEDEVLALMKGFQDRWFIIIGLLLTVGLVFTYFGGRAWAVLQEEAPRKAAEQAMRASEERFRLLYEDAPIGYQSLDANGCLREVNRTWLAFLGFSREEVVGKWFGDFLAAAEVDRFRENFPRFKTLGEIAGIQFTMRRKDGSHVLVEFDGKVAHDELGNFKQTHCTLRDMTTMKQAEGAIQALVASTVGSIGQDFFDRTVARLCQWLGSECALVGEIFDNKVVKVLSMQVDGVISHNFTASLSESACGEVVSSGFCLFSENARAAFPNDPILGKFDAMGYVGTALRDHNKETIGILCAMFRHRPELPQKVVEVMNIIAARAAAEIERHRMEAEKRTIEAQLRQAHKMEAIGTLAGGIAHDFNNILAAIIGYTELSMFDVSQWSPMHQNLEQVLKAGHRAKDLVRQILAFSRHGDEQRWTPVEVGMVIREGLKLLRASLPTTIEIRPNITAASCAVLADPTQIHQVLINLCANAAHAMRDQGGVLEVGLEAVDLDADGALHYPDISPGAYIKLTVRDTGHGMDAATRERIFDPYFTTKEVGEGSGLGLAVAHGIVQRLDGAISVQSAPGRGATFQVLLPRSERKPEGQAQGTGPLPGGRECILFVDDEEALVDMGEQMLNHLGYQVVTKTSSADALESFRALPDEFDLVITDFTMPQMTGVALAGEILNVRPDMPIILCTGFSEQIDEAKAKSEGIREFVMKPLSQRELAEVIRRVLDRS